MKARSTIDTKAAFFGSLSVALVSNVQAESEENQLK